jgi:hypothetical protein
MKNKSSIRDHQEPLEFHVNKKQVDPFKLQYRAPGVDIPGFNKHYSSLTLKGPMARKPGPLAGGRGGQHDPCFWNRGGGRWFRTRRRGGQVGRQRERDLPRSPFPA